MAVKKGKIDMLRNLLRYFFKITIRKAMATIGMYQFRRQEDEAIKSLSEVIDSVIQNKYSREEKIWIDKIEILRKELNESSSKISITDYGAGSPDLHLSAKEMNEGRVYYQTIGEVCRGGALTYKEAFLLFKLILKFQPEVVIEMGTSLGISAAYQAAALKLNHSGKLVTLEGAESLALLARENFKKLGLNNIDLVIGRFQDKLEGLLLKNAPVDFVFIDGHHDKEATLAYFNQILPFLSDGGILVFDDISWSQGMKEAWNTIQSNKNIKVSVDLQNAGICIGTKFAAREKKCFKVVI